MQTIERMMASNPNRSGSEQLGLADCIAACLECEQVCIACADACLGEQQVMDLRRCIRLNLDCADVCAATARVAGRLFGTDATLLMAQLEACARACATCGAECRHHEHHEHCQICAEACGRCEEQCRRALRSASSARLG